MFRSAFPLVVLLLAVCPSIAQQRAFTFQEYRVLNEGTSLDSLYRSAMHVDSTKAVFRGRTQEFWDAWQAFLRELGDHLKTSGFRWTSDTRLSTRIYFNADGSVNRFLYSFPRDHTDADTQKRFAELLDAFLAEHAIAVQAAEGFAQCGPVLFKATTAAMAE